MKQEQKENIVRLIRKGNTKSAIDAILEVENQNNTIDLIKSEFSRLKEKEIKGTINFEEYQMHLNRINDRIIGYLNKADEVKNFEKGEKRFIIQLYVLLISFCLIAGYTIYLVWNNQLNDKITNLTSFKSNNENEEIPQDQKGDGWLNGDIVYNISQIDSSISLHFTSKIRNINSEIEIPYSLILWQLKSDLVRHYNLSEKLYMDNPDLIKGEFTPNWYLRWNHKKIEDEHYTFTVQEKGFRDGDLLQIGIYMIVDLSVSDKTIQNQNQKFMNFHFIGYIDENILCSVNNSIIKPMIINSSKFEIQYRIDTLNKFPNSFEIILKDTLGELFNHNFFLDEEDEYLDSIPFGIFNISKGEEGTANGRSKSEVDIINPRKVSKSTENKSYRYKITYKKYDYGEDENKYIVKVHCKDEDIRNINRVVYMLPKIFIPNRAVGDNPENGFGMKITSKKDKIVKLKAMISFADGSVMHKEIILK